MGIKLEIWKQWFYTTNKNGTVPHKTSDRHTHFNIRMFGCMTLTASDGLC